VSKLANENVFVGCWKILYSSVMNEKIAVKFLIYLYVNYKWNPEVNATFYTQSYLSYSVQWNLWIHLLGISSCLTSQQNWMTSVWIFRRILLPCSCSHFTQNVIILSVFGNDYLLWIALKSVQYSLRSERNIFGTGWKTGLISAGHCKSLPEHLHASDLSLNSFRHSLKTFLFTQMIHAAH